MKNPFSRRDVLKAGTALAATGVFAESLRAAAPPAEPVTPALIAAAKKEGRVVHYTSVDLPLAERVSKGFEAKYPGISVALSAPAPSAYSPASRRSNRAAFILATWCSRPTRPIFVVWKREGPARALRAGGCRAALSSRHKDPDGPVRKLSGLSVLHGLQHRFW